MQIYNNTQIPQTVTAPSFKAIKTVKCKGLYKKYPELGQKLVNTLQTNKAAMVFCKRYDVDIIFDAYKDIMYSIKSTMTITFKNPAKTKLFGLISGARDSISIYGYGSKYLDEESLKDSTQNLILNIMNETDDENATGVLEGNILYKESDIKEFLNKKTSKIDAKKSRRDAEAAAKNKFETEQNKLNDSIKNLINSSK